jgi:hypothetical protein
LFAAAHAESVPDAAHDLGAARALGLGWTGAFRALDAAVGALLGWAPIGTRALRAELCGAALLGVAGLVVYALARRLVAAYAPEATRIGPAAAAIGSLAATLSVAWQLEAAPGGSILGALLALLPVAIVASAENLRMTRFAELGIALGLAATYEPLVGAAALLGAATYAALSARREGVDVRAGLRTAAPLLLAVPAAAIAPAHAWIRGNVDARLVLPRAAWAAPLGEAGASPRTTPLDLVSAELGWVLAAAAALGLVLAFMASRARPIAAALLVIAAVGYAGVLVGAPAGPTRWSGATLAALGVTTAIAAVAMQAAVRAVATANIPMAHASAVMILVLELALPARVADDAWSRAEDRARGAGSAWDEAAWGTVPAGAIVLLSDARALERIVATRATGAMRGDLSVVPLVDLGGRMASVEISREARLQPLLRDMALEGAPEELSLSSLAAARPLVMVFDPRWEKPLSRHLVPVGLFARFETEPRGPSDRRVALDLARPDLGRLERAATSPRDPDTCAAAASLLRARAVGFAAAGDRDLVARALDELRPFAPDDRGASELARRVVTAKGGIEVKDLAP